MAYCALTDILDQIDEAILIQLTDDENAGIVEESRVEKAIADADSEINGHIGARYSLPLPDPVPNIVRKFSVDVAIYNLYSRRQSIMPDERRERYNAAIRFFEQVAAGKASLGESDPEGSPAGTNAPEISGPPRIFDRSKMRGF
jgi:phage gp36-like protein